ncbi:unnamed protein product [Mytilus coruscus]|uniref:B box-type domain-containing protein n=1 Tax=Mytilus coruscus TaxID=42192 RepID=A0A6J8ARC5_MYTCO|nr:unnamed protein product [Mytilus coruscus]
MRDRAGLSTESDLSHEETKPAAMTRDNQQVSDLIDNITNKLTDPFDVTLHPVPLLNISTGMHVSNEVQGSLFVSQYVEIESVSSLIKQECEEHDQRLTFYCLDHYLTACALCVPEKHKQCTRLKPIEELASNAKTSAELFDIERGIEELDKTVDELNNHRQRNIDAIKDQRKTISREIKSFRKQINKHLDNLESDF